MIDVGCGGGLVAEALARSGGEVTGIDLGRTAISVAQRHAAGQSLAIRYHQATAEIWARGHADRYDLVVCMELLEHVPVPKSVIGACATMAKPDGWVIFATLNRNAKSHLFAIVGAEYVLGLVPAGTHDWRRFITPGELAGQATKAALRLAAARGLTYNPVSRKYRLTADLSVNYMLAFRKRPAPGARGSATLFSSPKGDIYGA